MNDKALKSRIVFHSFQARNVLEALEFGFDNEFELHGKPSARLLTRAHNANLPTTANSRCYRHLSTQAAAESKYHFRIHILSYTAVHCQMDAEKGRFRLCLNLSRFGAEA